jgi:glycosyltransferase involved in cell wall biosynthesis
MPSEVHKGLVSVIVPVFNRPAMLLRAVECVRAQSYRPIELIVVDDGSTDGTAALCDELAIAGPDLVRSVHRTNGGPGAARETGRAEARGEFLQYLDSDDWMAPNKIERQVGELRNEQAADLCYCGTVETREWEPGVRRVRGRTGEKLDSIFPHLLTGRLWHTISPLYRRSFSDRLGAWTSLRQEEDLEYDARAGALGARLAYCEEVLAEHRHHLGERAGGSSRTDRTRMKARADSHRLVYGHARSAGVDHTSPEMQRYARELFHLARVCGATGLRDEARELFRFAREASGPERAGGGDFRIYGALATVVGWCLAGRISGLLESVKNLDGVEQR